MTKIHYSPHPQLPFSKAVRAGDFVFISGQVPFGPDGFMVHGSIEVQTRVVLDGIKKQLEETGCTMQDVVKTTVWLDDPRDFGGYNRIYAEYFPKDPPARATVRSQLLLDCKIEVEAVAYKPQKG
jgi:2-iminobutanoate/2-iminopropanoate deaminase